MKIHLHTSLGSDKRGSVAVMMGLMMPIIIGFCGLGAEVAYWFWTQRSLQSAADAAAFSGAAQIAQGRNAADVEMAALNAAAGSGFERLRAESPVIQSPPLTGAFAGDAMAVEVSLTDNVPRFFSKLFFQSEFIQVSARSVSRTAGGRPSCILALNKTAGKAVSFAGSSELELDGCDVASNSIARDSIDFQGATRVVTECASAVGGIDGASANRLTLTDCAQPFEGTRSFPDPFAALTEPASGSCGKALKAALGAKPRQRRNVSPGTICGSGAGGPNVAIRGAITFAPGLYVLDGVNLRINATAEVFGAGVTFFLTGGSTVHFNGGADIQLRAPTNPLDPYHGVLIFADRDDAGLSHVLNGNSSTSFTGALYFPTSNVSFSGTNDANPNACTLLVADTIEFTGNSFFASNCTSLGISAAETAQVVLIVE